MTLLIQTLSRVPSVPVLTRFDCTFAFYEHNLRLCTLAKSGMAKIFLGLVPRSCMNHFRLSSRDSLSITMPVEIQGTSLANV